MGSRYARSLWPSLSYTRRHSEIRFSVLWSLDGIAVWREARRVCSVPVVLVVVHSKARRASVLGPVILQRYCGALRCTENRLLVSCGPRYITVEGTASLGARSCEPLIMLLCCQKHGESLCSVSVGLVIVHLRAQRASLLGHVVF